MGCLFDQGTAAWYPDRSTAHDAMRQLQAAGIPKSKMSMMSKRLQWHPGIQGFYQPGYVMLGGLGLGSVCGAVFGLLVGGVIFLISGTALLQTIFLSLPVGILIGAFGGSLLFLGRSEGGNTRYKVRMQSGQVLLAVHGTPEMIAQASRVFQSTGSIECRDHEQSGGHKGPSVSRQHTHR